MGHRILGVDPGSRRTGWAVLNTQSFGQPFDIMSCGLIDAGREKFPKNLSNIYSELKEVAIEYCPDIMSLESVFSGVNKSSLIKLSQARGVICLLSAEFNMKLKEYTPRFIKKSIAGYGGADKLQMKEALKLLCVSYSPAVAEFLKDDVDDNISDAIAVAVCCATDSANIVEFNQ